MNGIQYSQCSQCKHKIRTELLIPADGGAMMVCEECFRKNEAKKEEEEKQEKINDCE